MSIYHWIHQFVWPLAVFASACQIRRGLGALALSHYADRQRNNEKTLMDVIR